MPVTSLKIKALIVASLMGLLPIGAPIAMSILEIKFPVSGEWKERFQDVNKLNDYAQSHSVEIGNALIEKAEIDGAVIHSGRFENTDWKSISMKRSSIANSVFEKGTIEGVDFSESTFSNVVFEDVKFRGVRFFHATLKNVRFVRCSFNGVNIDRTKNSRIEVVDSKVISSSFSEGQLVAEFLNTKFYEGVELTDLQPPSALKFEKSELNQVELSRSELNELVLDTVTSYKSGFDTGVVGKVTITGGDISFGFSEVKIDQLNAYNLGSVGLAMPGAVINAMIIKNCREINNLNIFQSTTGSLAITNCTINNFTPAGSKIGTLEIKNGSISNSAFQKIKAQTLILENVTLGGELDFTGAQVGELKTKDVTKQYDLKLITTGSNVSF